jgi:hypothetical protein
MDKKLDASFLANLLNCLETLEAWNTVSVWLMLLVRSLLQPRLHELRAKELMDVAMSVVNCRLSDADMERAAAVLGVSVDGVVGESGDDETSTPTLRETSGKVTVGDSNGKPIEKEEPGVAASDCASDNTNTSDTSKWKREFLFSCMEHLRRHENFIGSTWWVAQASKLLCSCAKYGIYLDDLNAMDHMSDSLRELAL